ncbi:hypothetical protein WJX73_005773 [Symbiochloris irregularis]|uniref:Uncharacterized protein n=1 Tax=Symbiochloris irregularis TaxID=706552 RepID=A0AAW1NRS4_9CHLO
MGIRSDHNGQAAEWGECSLLLIEGPEIQQPCADLNVRENNMHQGRSIKRIYEGEYAACSGHTCELSLAQTSDGQ